MNTMENSTDAKGFEDTSGDIKGLKIGEEIVEEHHKEVIRAR